MSDGTEGSAAMRGSVEGGPIAWAVMYPRTRQIEGTFTDRDEAEEWAESDEQIVPLYPHPPQNKVVRLPALDPNGAPGWNAAIGAVREALANAGVDWDTE